MAGINDLLRNLEAELGYIEKSRENFDLYGVNCLFPKREYGGNDNYTKYAYYVQHDNGLPWCQTFVASVLQTTFGHDPANKLLCGMLYSASTMDVKNKMVKEGREVPLSDAQPGDIVYRSRSGGGHVGFVVGIQDGQIVTIEGNSSNADKEAWNGGQVVKHVGATWQWCVRPDYASVIGRHWIREDGIWYYQDADGRNSYGWQEIEETGGTKKHWYYFNSIGQMLTGMQFIDGKWYALMPEGPLEGACCKTDGTAACYIWDT